MGLTLPLEDGSIAEFLANIGWYLKKRPFTPVSADVLVMRLRHSYLYSLLILIILGEKYKLYAQILKNNTKTTVVKFCCRRALVLSVRTYSIVIT